PQRIGNRMVSFSLTDEQRALQEMVRKFVEKEVAPAAHRFNKSGDFPKDISQKAWERATITEAVPTEYGGLGLGVMEDVIINEELGAGCLGMTTSICVNMLALYPIVLFGSKEQIERLVTPFTREPQIASFCLSEPGAGSDAGGLSTMAK